MQYSQIGGHPQSSYKIYEFIIKKLLLFFWLLVGTNCKNLDFTFFSLKFGDLKKQFGWKLFVFVKIIALVGKMWKLNKIK